VTVIDVKQVTKTYGDLVAVDDVSLAVGRPEVVGFVGPNGAGKSTVLKMLSTFALPTAGTLTVDGLDVVEQALEVRRRIGYLPGDTPLYHEMRVGDFLAFVARARGLRGGDLTAGLDRVVDLCDVGEVTHRSIGQCSTGFRQRLGLAAALVHDPPVLLLDEPTHGFDPLQVMAFRDLLTELKSERAILFSTHIIQDVEAISDRVLIIHQGRLLGDGPVASLATAAGAPGAGLEDTFARLVRTRTQPRGTGGPDA